VGNIGFAVLSRALFIAINDEIRAILSPICLFLTRVKKIQAFTTYAWKKQSENCRVKAMLLGLSFDAIWGVTLAITARLSPLKLLTTYYLRLPHDAQESTPRVDPARYLRLGSGRTGEGV
jgi:hypothetical protein